MRIISGQFKSRIIVMPKGIRPTQGKVRKAIFDILGDIEGCSFLELFAGSGAVGLEAASKGAKQVVMMEYRRDCQRAIEKNISSLGASACTLCPKETEAAIGMLYRQKRIFDIVFLDPPYTKSLIPSSYGRLNKGGSGSMSVGEGESLSKKTLQMLAAYDILAPDGFIIIQHFKKDYLPDSLGELILWKHARYGDTILSFYKKT